MAAQTSGSTHFPEFHVVVGPMYSGKTRKLQEIMYRNTGPGRDGLTVNHANDEVRQEVEAPSRVLSPGGHGAPVRPEAAAHAGHVRAHDGKRCPAVFVRRLSPDVFELPEYADAEWVAVDEAQFFDADDLRAFVQRARYVDRKNLVVAGLHADDRGACFMDFNYLLPACTSFKLLSARCQAPGCLAEAHHTHAAFDKRYKVDYKHTDQYVAMCDYHFLEAKKGCLGGGQDAV